MSQSRLLCLDFDGVTHPAADTVQFNFKPGTPLWQMDVALRAQGRFVWMDRLIEALDGIDAAILVHSTWRRHFSDSELKGLLPTQIAARVINLDANPRRRSDTADEYVRSALDRMSPSSVCVIDDRPQFFQSGLSQAWMDEHSGCFIWTDPSLGLSDPDAWSQLRAWALDAPADESRPQSSVEF